LSTQGGLTIIGRQTPMDKNGKRGKIRGANVGVKSTYSIKGGEGGSLKWV